MPHCKRINKICLIIKKILSQLIIMKKNLSIGAIGGPAINHFGYRIWIRYWIRHLMLLFSIFIRNPTILLAMINMIVSVIFWFICRFDTLCKKRTSKIYLLPLLFMKTLFLAFLLLCLTSEAHTTPTDCYYLLLSAVSAKRHTPQQIKELIKEADITYFHTKDFEDKKNNHHDY